METLTEIACLFALFTLTQGAIFSADAEKRITSYVETSMKCHNIPGMTLSVVKGNNLVGRQR